MEASHGMQIVLHYVQVIPAFEEAIAGMALGGIRRCCICLLSDSVVWSVWIFEKFIQVTM